MESQPLMPAEQTELSESSKLLNPSVDEKDTKRSKKKEYKAGEVNDVETFSDLVVAVAVGTSSDQLADRILEPDNADKAIPWLMFFLQSFLIWYLWQSGMVVTNLGNMLTSNQLTAKHYFVVFGTMSFVVMFAKACEGQNVKLGVVTVLLCRILLALAFIGDVRRSNPPEWMSPARWAGIKRVTNVLSAGAFFEFAPIVVTLIQTQFHDLTNQEEDSALLWGGLCMVIFVIGRRSYHVYKYDLDPHYKYSEEQTLMDVEHLQERYQMIVFVLLGQLCFAAASAPGAYLQSASVLLTAICCFFLYFTARVKGRKEAWVRSAKSSILCQHLHIVLFCAIPCIGAVYVKMIDEYEKGPLGIEALASGTWYGNSNVLLGVFTGCFLVSVGFMEAMTQDPQESGEVPRSSLKVRVLVKLTAAALVIILHCVWNHAHFIVPVVLVVAAAVLVWGTETTNE